MRNRLGIIITIALAIGVLIAINSLAYVSEQNQPDTELNPNRSTYHSGATGTRALYDFLNESGYQVMRWRETPDRLLGSSGQKVQTFVIIGTPRISVDEEEAKSLLLWVARGGRLVIIDRRPDDSLLPQAGDWKITTEFLDFPGFDADPANSTQMTENVKPLRPVLPTLLTRDVNSVMPSRYFSAIKYLAVSKSKSGATHATPRPTSTPPPPADTSDDLDDFLSPEESREQEHKALTATNTVSPAPVVHLQEASNSAVLLDYLHGKGRIVLLSDPFIVTNVGLRLEDNLQLATNLLGSYDGLIAFDEYHQGRGATSNEFVSYFAGTPVLAISGQIVLLILLIVWTRGRRFARPLPLPQVDRRSSLEFVASMAELQQRAQAYDLAIENIYARTRRVLARYAGMAYNSPRAEIAERVALRSTMTAHQIETLMRQAEDAINGGEISERKTIHLVKRLRELEISLGLRMRSREVKQAGQKI
jgi:hypothetical protein